MDPALPSALRIKELANVRKDNRAVRVSKISSIEDLSAYAEEGESRDPTDIAGIGAGDKKDKGSFLKSLLSSSHKTNKNPQHSSAGDLAAKHRKHKLNFASSAPYSAVKTDNNDNILDSRGPQFDVEGSGEGGGHNDNFSEEQNIEWQLPEYIIIHPPEVENTSAPTNLDEAPVKRPGRTMETSRTIPVRKPPSKHDKHVRLGRAKDQESEKDKLTFEKAALILYEDEMAKEKLKAAVVELTSSCEKYRHDLRTNEDKHAQEILKLQLENEALLLKLTRANDSANQWKSKYQRQENEVVNLSKLKLVTKENVTLKEDLEVLKSVIRRLNQELSFSQEKLKSKHSSDPAQIPVFSTSSESPSVNDAVLPFKAQDYLILEPKTNLQPLLTAYDEIIEEKNEIIKDHEVALASFKARCQEIVQENEELYKIFVENRDTGSITLEEWKFLHDNAVMVLEENELLHEQCKVLRTKAEMTARSHEKEVAQIKSQISLMEKEAIRSKANAKEAQDQCTFLGTQISKMNAVIQQRIPVEQHEAYISEHKRLFDELKVKYTEETKVLKEKLLSVEPEKERLTKELALIDAENTQLVARLQSLEKLQSTSKAQLKSVQTELSNATKSKDVTARAVNEIVELVETVIAEREALLASFFEQQALNEQLMNLRKKESQLVEELRGKIQLMENVHQEEMEKYRGHITKLEELLETIGERHRADVGQLRELVKEKSTHIEKLGFEKEQLMEDLETVWRATTRDANNLRGMPSPLLKKYNFLKEKQQQQENVPS